MSAADRPSKSAGSQVRLVPLSTAVVQLAALGGNSSALAAALRDRGCTLPSLGQATTCGAGIVLSTRPGRWWTLEPESSDGASAAAWLTAANNQFGVVDLTSALAVWELSGPAAREVLARGCRLDLDPRTFPSGSAAATVMAQVSVTLVAQPGTFLLLTPGTTARHFLEWLVHAATPFGYDGPLPPAEHA